MQVTDLLQLPHMGRDLFRVFGRGTLQKQKTKNHHRQSVMVIFLQNVCIAIMSTGSDLGNSQSARRAAVCTADLDVARQVTAFFDYQFAVADLA